jgi:membrane-bound ClpP family serine protease
LKKNKKQVRKEKMGVGEFQAHMWGIGGVCLMFFVSIFAIAMAGLSISYAKQGTILQSTFLDFSYAVIVISVLAVIVGCFVIYKLVELHNLYIKVVRDDAKPGSSSGVQMNDSNAYASAQPNGAFI